MVGHMRTPPWLAAGLLGAIAFGTLAVAAPANAAPAAGGQDAYTYTGTWATGAPDEKWSTTAGSTATAKVNVGPGGGTISVYGNRDTGSGRASVTVDTRTPVTVDTYINTAPPGVDRNWYTTPWLAEGPHTVKINVLGTKQTAATSAAISIKGVNTTNGTIVWPTTTPTATPKITATAAAGNAQATLNWEALDIPDPATAGVWVQLADGTKGAWYEAEKGSHTFTGLTNGTEVTLEAFSVRHGGGNIASTSVKVTPTGGTTTPAPSLPAGVPTNVRWADEFNDTTIDPAKWIVTDGWAVNDVTTRTANAREAGGNLVLKKTTASDGAHVYSGEQEDNVGTMLQVGEYAEARVRFPAGLPNWDAWWTSGPDWPRGGEHDIAEVLDGEMTTNYHYEDANGNHVAANQGVVPGTWDGAFHTFGVHRKADSADVYYDGKLVKSYPTNDPDLGQSLIFNTGAGTTVGTASEMLVDYVRIHGSSTSTPTPTPTPTPAPAPTAGLTQLEQDALNLINAKRAEVGAPALVIDAGMQAVARKHSADMRDRNYFAHTSPDGVTFGQRLDAAGEGGGSRSENIARGQTTAQRVVDVWMGSSGHKANLLNPNFRATGLGVATGNGSTLSGPFWTQDFRSTAAS
jgi:uncharacterized protein YkwD